jgi:hypothetical protein
MADPRGVAPMVAVRKHPSRRQRVAPLIELRIQKWFTEPKLQAHCNRSSDVARLRFASARQPCSHYTLSEGW